MKAELITIGDEILIGQIINTNAAYIGERLLECGIKLDRITTVGDTYANILDAFSEAWKKHELVIVTGGLGPTHDDITKRVVTDFFQTALMRSDEAISDMEIMLQKRGRKLTALHEEQALIPRGSNVIRNMVGTAPGFFFEENEKLFIVMPGVPLEMKSMMERTILPMLKEKSKRVIRTLTLHTTGIFESTLAERISDVLEVVGPEGLAFLPSQTGVRVRITVESDDARDADGTLQRARELITSKVGDYIYGEGAIELETVIGSLLRERKHTLSVAESCTGGLISHRITNVSGSSTYFLRSVVTYSNESKRDLLRIPDDILDAHGAVSSEVACSMAKNVRKFSETDYGLSATGIAGPTGGTDEKPVGVVWIGFSSAMETIAYKFLFGDDRLRNKERTAEAALEILRRKLLGLPVK